MSTVTESDIKELKDLIVALREDMNTRMSALETGQRQIALSLYCLNLPQGELYAGANC